MSGDDKDCKCSICRFMERNADALGKSMNDAFRSVCGKDGDVRVVGALLLLYGTDGHYGHFLKPPMWGEGISQEDANSCYEEFSKAVRSAAEDLISEARKGILS